MKSLLYKLSVVLSVSLLSVGVACSAPSSGQTSQSKATSVTTGINVGDRLPEFSIRLTDGNTVTSARLVTEGKPVFLYFFATW